MQLLAMVLFPFISFFSIVWRLVTHLSKEVKELSVGGLEELGGHLAAESLRHDSLRQS